MQAGTRLGPYEILSPLGAGGMGEVYRARDTRLGREVAIKVLPDAVASDPRALSRFEHEAKAVAALSHPNILALYDVGKAGGVDYAVSELLEGENLRAFISRGPVPVRRALEIAEQVAQGLAAAHEKGIIHRDVKPENVFVTKDGHVKVLDFGLARTGPVPTGRDVTESPTVEKLTSGGAVVGTVAYMSPEQARGLAVDHRSDQFSLGVVLYEMLTGTRPFEGASVAETLAAIIRDEPEPLERAAPRTPAPARLLVDRLLTKEPEGRYDSTRDLARDLATWKLFSAGASGEAMAASGTAGRPGRVRWIPWAITLGLAVSLGIVALLARRRTEQNPRTARFEIVLPEGYRLFTRGGQFLDISPDGKFVVYAAFSWKKPWEVPDEPRLFLHSLDHFQSSPIPGTEGGSQPLFSPDGRRIAFLQSRDKGEDLMVVPVEGGTPTTVRQRSEGLGAWAADGTIISGSTLGPLMRFPWGGGKPEPATTLDEASSEVSHRLPHLLPDGKTVLYTAIRHEPKIHPEGGSIYVQRLGEKTRHLLVEDGTDGRFAPPDLLLFGRRGTLMVARLDMSSLKLIAPPEPLLDGVTHAVYDTSIYVESAVVGVAVARDGTLVFAPGSVVPEQMRRLAWLDRQGGQTQLDFPKGEYYDVRISPDGRQVLVSTDYPGSQTQLLDLERGLRRNVTFRGDSRWAIWGPGPDRFTFDSNEGGAKQLYMRPLASPQEVTEKLATGALTICAPGSWSADGRLFAFVVHKVEQVNQVGIVNHDIWLLEHGGVLRPFLTSPSQEARPEIAPDGKYLLYGSNEPGHAEVFVKPLDGSAGPVQVSAGGGSARWTHDGSIIYYSRSVEGKPRLQTILRVVVKKGQGDSLAFSQPEKILEGTFLSWDLARDGRFLVVQPPTDADNQAWWEHTCPNRIRVVLGGVDSLRREAVKER